MKSKKTKEKKYKVKENTDIIREQLGLNYYSGQETERVEVKKSKHPKTTIYNDIDLNNWKEYSDIITDSLWLLGARERYYS